MRYNGIFGILFIIILFIAFFNSSLNIIFLSKVHNEDINIELKIKYFFNIININLQIYPQKNKPNKKKKVKTNINKGEIKSKKFSKQDILQVYNAVKKINIEEIYSDISFGGTNIHFVCFIYLLINTIYGNIINIFDSNKMYLKVTPDFTQNFINTNIKIHIKPKIKNLIEIGFKTIKVYIKGKKKTKEVKENERTWINKKSYGDNS